MEVCKNFRELSKCTGINEYEIEKSWEKFIQRGSCSLNGKCFDIHSKNNEVHFVNFDSSNDEECKKYFLNYEINDYTATVYVDDIEKWQLCTVLDVLNVKDEIERAIVTTKLGTRLNRMVKFVIDEDDQILEDGYIYFIDKNIS